MSLDEAVPYAIAGCSTLVGSRSQDAGPGWIIGVCAIRGRGPTNGEPKGSEGEPHLYSLLEAALMGEVTARPAMAELRDRLLALV